MIAKTLITGGSGFVGSAVLRQLIAAGHSVRALVRSNSDRRNLMGLPVEIVTGDLRDRSSLDRALAGCSSLFHVAAVYKLWGPLPRRNLRNKCNRHTKHHAGRSQCRCDTDHLHQ